MILGDQLYNLTKQTQGTLFELGEYFQLSFRSHELMILNISESKDGQWTLKYPLAEYQNSTPLIGTKDYNKDDLIAIYYSFNSRFLPLHCIYSLVMICESVFVDAIRSILICYPKKIENNKKIMISHVFKYNSLESIRQSIFSEYINELTSLSPPDLAHHLEKIFGFNLYESPVFHKYIELKVTRDTLMYNNGIANHAYVVHAGSHARVKQDQLLPVNVEYFLTSLQCCMQLVEILQSEFHTAWPSALYEEKKKAKLSNE